METLCRLSYWGTADPVKASRERLQVDLLCDGETTRSAARIRNRGSVGATGRRDAGVAAPTGSLDTVPPEVEMVALEVKTVL